MIKPAQLYSSELKKLFYEIAYDERFKFLEGCSYSDEYKPSESSWGSHEFVSIINDIVIGYMRYSISRDNYNVKSLQVVNFTFKPNIIFARDLYEVMHNIFEKYNFNKISFQCVIGNPIEKTYDKLIKKYNGNIVGIHKKHMRLMDGKLYDCKIYEILREDYFKSNSK